MRVRFLSGWRLDEGLFVPHPQTWNLTEGPWFGPFSLERFGGFHGNVDPIFAPRSLWPEPVRERCPGRALRENLQAFSEIHSPTRDCQFRGPRLAREGIEEGKQQFYTCHGQAIRSALPLGGVTPESSLSARTPIGAYMGVFFGG